MALLPTRTEDVRGRVAGVDPRLAARRSVREHVVPLRRVLRAGGGGAEDEVPAELPQPHHPDLLQYYLSRQHA